MEVFVGRGRVWHAAAGVMRVGATSAEGVVRNVAGRCAELLRRVALPNSDSIKQLSPVPQPTSRRTPGWGRLQSRTKPRTSLQQATTSNSSPGCTSARILTHSYVGSTRPGALAQRDNTQSMMALCIGIRRENRTAQNGTPKGLRFSEPAGRRGIFPENPR